jgi:drug/metabolite transporter (DMT)-like permease
LPSGLQATSTEQIIFQSFYQGLVPTLFGLLLIGYAARTLGSNTASTMMAGVPGVGAILGVIFLGETLEVFGWLALLTLTTGIIITSLPKVEIVKD